MKRLGMGLLVAGLAIQAGCTSKSKEQESVLPGVDSVPTCWRTGPTT
jgi:hypothetical protein